jgi:hypothetical protein
MSPLRLDAQVALERLPDRLHFRFHAAGEGQRDRVQSVRRDRLNAVGLVGLEAGWKLEDAGERRGEDLGTAQVADGQRVLAGLFEGNALSTRLAGALGEFADLAVDLRSSETPG